MASIFIHVSAVAHTETYSFAPVTTPSALKNQSLLNHVATNEPACKNRVLTAPLKGRFGNGYFWLILLVLHSLMTV